MASLPDSLAGLEAARRERIQAVAADPLRWAGVRHLCQLAIQACIDTADEVLAQLGAEEPPRSRDVFPALVRAGVLSRETAAALAGLADFQNALAHAHLRVTVERVEERLAALLPAARAFAEAVARWRERR